jgi:hypothetical protein
MKKQEAIDLLKDMQRRLSNRIKSKEDVAIETAISALKQQLNGGWISVGERLPDKSGHYLVTYHEWSDGNYLPKYEDTKVKILRYQDAIFKLPVCCDTQAEQDTHREVLAWRELPEPYKEG